MDVDRIVRTVAANEAELRKALNQYSFTREVVIQSIGPGGEVSGEYRRTAEIVFDSGRIRERILSYPPSTLTEIQITSADLETLMRVHAFVIEPSNLEQYNFAFLRAERLNDIESYVFEVKPKALFDPNRVAELKDLKDAGRFFKGLIWVDSRSLQIVKMQDDGMFEFAQRFDHFETYREQIDSRYWFPVSTRSDEPMAMFNGRLVHLRVRIRHTDFKQSRR